MSLSGDPLWYKDAIIYEAHVKCFADSTADGIGDFPGLTGKLDYLRDLGITCVWLLPFFPSPLRDDGYDIADYRNVHPSYGTLEDFKTFVREAHARGIRVLIELVVNHTSEQHPWFQAARRAPRGSREREFYVWSDTDHKFPETRIIFTDTEASNWTYDPVAGQYYWHRFFHHQPDLNHNNPEVVEAVIDVMRFWLDLGVDALRLDAVPYLCVREGTNNENLPETHAVLKRIRRELEAQYPDRMLLAEANQWPADVRAYFGDGDECHMAFHFPLMPRIFMAVRQEDRHPITEILRQTPEIPPTCQWALFLRNHDELTLEMVTDEERDYMYSAYAADPMMRLNVGIRRRLAPLMENSRRRVELLNVLLFTLPGTPILYYGDEIGMGDNIYLGDRNGVRTPMQWSGDRNAGFSRADPARLYAPPIMDPVYGYQSINVEAQERYPFSLLNWMKRMIALRKEHRVLGRGGLEFVPCSNRKVLAYLRRDEAETLLVVANLSRVSQPAEIDLAGHDGLHLVELIGETEFPRIGGHPYLLTLGPYGYYVFRIQAHAPSMAARPAAVEPSAALVHTLPGLLAGVAWETLLDGALRRYIEREALTGFLERQRWFTAGGRCARAARFVDWGALRGGTHPIFVTLVDVTLDTGATARYFVPLATTSHEAAEQVQREAPALVLARITGARKGLLVDASADPEACELLRDAVAAGREVVTQHGTLRARRTPAWLDDDPADARPVQRLAVEQTNTTVRFGVRKMLKLYRRIEDGENPELEIARELSATDFTRVPPLAGWIEYAAGAGEPATLALLQGLVRHQGDGWERMLDELSRYYEGVAALQEPPAALAAMDLEDAMAQDAPELVLGTVGVPLTAVAMLGRRTAELHRALAGDGSMAAFAPEPMTTTDAYDTAARVTQSLAASLDLLSSHRESLPEHLQPLAGAVLATAQALGRLAEGPFREGLLGQRIRNHGDYHLGQLLWTEQDFVILDFEGEPVRSIEERRSKQSPLRDVAGMVRSLGYAAVAGTLAFERRRPGSHAAIASWSRLWETWTSATFLRSYRGGLEGSGLVPEDTPVFMALLRLFMLDKALYELRYELNTRPDWVSIPLEGLLHLPPSR